MGVVEAERLTGAARLAPPMAPLPRHISLPPSSRRLSQVHEHHIWYLPPSCREGATAAWIMYLLTIPLKAFIHCTVPDVMNKKWSNWCGPPPPSPSSHTQPILRPSPRPPSRPGLGAPFLPRPHPSRPPEPPGRACLPARYGATIFLAVALAIWPT